MFLSKLRHFLRLKILNLNFYAKIFNLKNFASKFRILCLRFRREFRTTLRTNFSTDSTLKIPRYSKYTSVLTGWPSARTKANL